MYELTFHLSKKAYSDTCLYFLNPIVRHYELVVRLLSFSYQLTYFTLSYRKYYN